MIKMIKRVPDAALVLSPCATDFANLEFACNTGCTQVWT